MKLDHSLKDREFGRLVVSGAAFKAHDGKRRRAFVVAKCKCGTSTVVRVDGLLSSGVESCGCAQKDSAVALGHSRRGELAPGYRHGGKGTPLYGVWAGMISRCNDPNATGYHNYGGRGISVFPAWLDFIEFRNWATSHGYIPYKVQLDRENNDGNYEPSNCHFVPVVVNARNRRTNVLLTAFGETKCVADWAEDSRAAASLQTIYKRLQNHWTAEDAISRPTIERNP